MTPVMTEMFQREGNWGWVVGNQELGPDGFHSMSLKCASYVPGDSNRHRGEHYEKLSILRFVAEDFHARTFHDL